MKIMKIMKKECIVEILKTNKSKYLKSNKKQQTQQQQMKFKTITIYVIHNIQLNRIYSKTTKLNSEEKKYLFKNENNQMN